MQLSCIAEKALLMKVPLPAEATDCGRICNYHAFLEEDDRSLPFLSII